MHTDEYEISLSRELDVCRRKVRILQKKLVCREKKFNMSTEEFAREFHAAKIDTQDSDFLSWFYDFEALGKWQENLEQYERLLSSLKA